MNMILVYLLVAMTCNYTVCANKRQRGKSSPSLVEKSSAASVTSLATLDESSVPITESEDIGFERDFEMVDLPEESDVSNVIFEKKVSCQSYMPSKSAQLINQLRLGQLDPQNSDHRKDMEDLLIRYIKQNRREKVQEVIKALHENSFLTLHPDVFRRATQFLCQKQREIRDEARQAGDLAQVEIARISNQAEMEVAKILSEKMLAMQCVDQKRRDSQRKCIGQMTALKECRTIVGDDRLSDSDQGSDFESEKYAENRRLKLDAAIKPGSEMEAIAARIKQLRSEVHTKLSLNQAVAVPF